MKTISVRAKVVLGFVGSVYITTILLVPGHWKTSGEFLNPASAKAPKEIDGELIGIHEKGILSMALSPDGFTLVTSGIFNSTCGWDLRGKKKLWTWDDGPWQKTVTAFSPDGRLFFAAGSGSTGASPVDVRSTKTWQVEKTLKEHKKSERGFAVSTDSKLLYAADFSDSVLVWSMEKWKVLATFKCPSYVHAIRLSRDNQVLFAAGSEELWAIDASNGKRLRSVRAHGMIDRSGIYGLDISPVKKMVATGGVDTNVVLWNAETFEQIRTLKGHKWGVEALGFVPDGTHLVSCDGEETCVWETESGKLLKRIPAIKDALVRPNPEAKDRWPDLGPSCLVVSPTGSTFYVGDKGGRIMKYDLKKLITRPEK